MTDTALWTYNCTDCVNTREVGEVELDNLQKLGLEGVDSFQQRLFWPVLRAMLLGVRIDLDAKKALIAELEAATKGREEWFQEVLSHPLKPRSSDQMQKLFYEDFRMTPIRKRGSNRVTCDDDALDKMAKREPMLLPLINKIREYRSLGVFLSTFAKMPLDSDLRMRCSFNICGTETYRLSSSKNAFGSGGNLQNLPKGDEIGLFPNIRRLFIPDEGYVFFDMDLDRADLQVVVWEADDAELKMALREGLDLHCFNALSIFDIKGIPPDELKESHPNYHEHRERIGYPKRQAAKQGVHAVDYYCKAKTLSTHLGVSVLEAEKFIRKWLGAHPGIDKWHRRTEEQLKTRHYVENRFGYRRHYFDRLDGLLPEALAWQPQSTVACVINRAWVNIHEEAPEAQVLLQVHDSLAGQIPSERKEELKSRLLQLSKIVIPYEDPLTIPISIKTSEKSWGDCK